MFIRLSLPFSCLWAITTVAFASLPNTAYAQQQTSIPLEYYGELPALEEAVLSPSGDFTALLTTVRGERAILILDKSGAVTKQLVVGDAKVRGIHWAGEEAILLLRTETGKLPRQYLQRKIEWWRGNVIPLNDAVPVVSIFAGQRSIANAIAGFYGIREVDGRWKGYFGGFRRGSTSGERNRLLDDGAALFEVDLLTGDTELADYASVAGTSRDWLVAEDGEVGARLDIDRQNGSWTIKDGDGKTIARGRAPLGRVSLEGFGSSGASIVYSVYDPDRQSMRYFEADGGDQPATPKWNQIRIADMIIEPYTGVVKGVQGTDTDYRMIDEAKQSQLQAVYDAFRQRKNIDVELANLNADLSAMIVSTSGTYDSGTWYRVDPSSNARAIVGLERPAIQGRSIGKVSRFEYTASDGLKMDGVLTLPPGKEPTNLPVVVLPHGGPAAHDEVRFDWWAQGFASRGYAVFQPNFRGSTGRGAAFIEAGNGEWGRKMQSDKSDGLMALAEAGIVDPDRACIVGASYGGYAALAGVTMQQGIYRCAVSVNGVANVESQMRFMAPDSTDVLSRVMRARFGKRTDLDSISPTEFADQADAPILLIHGRDDTVVPFSQSAQMEDALKDAKKSVKLIELDGEDHWLSQSGTRKRMLREAVSFVEQHNPPN